MSRRERQRDEIMSALRRQHYSRVAVLSREHLAEFPDDVDVMAATAEAERCRSGHGATWSGDT